jgi:hypothetical protein
MSLVIEMTEWPSLGALLVFAPLRAVALLNVSLRHAGKSGVKVVHAHCPETEHLRLLPESLYEPVIRSAVHIDGEQPDELTDRRELRACNLHVPLERGSVGIDVCRTLIRVPSSLKYTL